MCGAGRAGRIGSLVERRRLARAALGAWCGQKRLVLGDGAEAVDEAGLEIVGEFKLVAIGDRSVGLGHLGMAGREDAIGVSIIDDLVGLEHAALVIELHIALCRDHVSVTIVDELLGFDEKPVLLSLRLSGRCRLGDSGRDALAEAPRKSDAGAGTHQGAPSPGQAEITHAGASTPPHQPSSWYNKASEPNMLPTTAGAQAATGALSSPAPPRSPTSFVAT